VAGRLGGDRSRLHGLLRPLLGAVHVPPRHRIREISNLGAERSGKRLPIRACAQQKSRYPGQLLSCSGTCRGARRYGYPLDVDVLQPTHLIFILVVALLVLGPKRLPEVGRSLGKGLRDFRGALSGMTDPDEESSSPETPTQVTPVTPATTTLPEESPTAPPYSAVAEQSPDVERPAEPASSGVQTGSGLLPHVEPDETLPIAPTAGPSHQD
jgi:sec-independent protein translocase protein TatA